MSFMKELKNTLDEDFNEVVTENGAIGYRTTGKELLNLNFDVASMRNKSESEIREKFAKAYFENKLLAIKWLFFASDVREGMGERRLFRICINWLAKESPEIVRRVINLIPEYNRWDNILVLLESELKDEVIEIIKSQLTRDMKNRLEDKPISLLAKWLPSINASSEKTKYYAKTIIKGLKISSKAYRKMLSSLRKHLNVVEVKMSAKEWDKIDYSAVPSKANLIYSNAFLRNDTVRRRDYLASLAKGETKINSGVLFPYEIVHKYTNGLYYIRERRIDTAVEEMWKALPDYVKGNGDTICVADGSGSMLSKVGSSGVSCLDVANALAIYFAERCTGEFQNKYITFSTRPQLVDLSSGHSLKEKIEIAFRHNEVSDTNIEAVFDLILKTAINNNMSQEDMPKNILILSDMEFNDCVMTSNYGGYGSRRNNIQKKLFTIFAERYAEYGYNLPRLVFWNICSRTGAIPVRENDLGVALVSGFSPTIMKMVLSNKTDPFECLLEQLNSERYKPVEDAVIDLV